jgi:hypothetical protein
MTLDTLIPGSTAYYTALLNAIQAVSDVVGPKTKITLTNEYGGSMVYGVPTEGLAIQPGIVSFGTVKRQRGRDYSRSCMAGCSAGLIPGTPGKLDGTPGESAKDCPRCDGTGYELRPCEHEIKIERTTIGGPYTECYDCKRQL